MCFKVCQMHTMYGIWWATEQKYSYSAFRFDRQYRLTFRKTADLNGIYRYILSVQRFFFSNASRYKVYMTTSKIMSAIQPVHMRQLHYVFFQCVYCIHAFIYNTVCLYCCVCIDLSRRSALSSHISGFCGLVSQSEEEFMHHNISHPVIARTLCVCVRSRK